MKKTNKSNFSSLSKKQCFEMIAGYQRNIKDAERFFKEELDREISNYKTGIVEIEEILLTKYKTRVN
tara:strand:- start:590 stop:790 length:201 start_codon:yes stop_codon:yes gene_type:complete